MLIWNDYVRRVLVFIIYHVGLLHAMEQGAVVRKRDLVVATTGTPAPTTPATPTCKISSLTLIGDDTEYFACCEGTTVSGSQEVINWDCNPLRLTYARLNQSEAFYCGGISGEENARKRCDTRWGWLTDKHCFQWTECFKGVCKLEAEMRGSSADASFCGDGRCDPATESHEDCPTDCCPTINDECLVRNNTCPEPCCSTSSCCKEPYSVSNIWFIIIGSVVGVIFLITVCCCCCCFCCVRKCLRHARSSSEVV
ncbi:uncharacterized protein LOC121424393 [Lytechinus variegatus]|uniref:uncharacterized protein LOC121424393 n=1 Tax=Lytechinus variegatus TaxID=7654 RepID=UPI001BB1081E|nr:uncharacterized protein LOC121424393 [Lytechinus variegatus]